MGETNERERLDDEDRLFEEAFLLMAQTRIQKLLNEKQLRYRDLSKRLGVSEARVSQMMGDEASNLTIRTIARIYRQLGEEPVIMSRRELDFAASGGGASSACDGTWTMTSADTTAFEVARVRLVDDDAAVADPRPSRASDWIDAGPQLVARGA